MLCPSCGTTLADNAKFCTHCGMQQKAGQTHTQTTSPPPIAMPAQALLSTPQTQSPHTHSGQQGSRRRNVPTAIMAAIITGALTILATVIGIFAPRVFDTSANQPPIPQLKASYNGIATGYTNGSLTFALGSEDPQGNVSMVVTFTIAASGKQERYSCHGQVTKERNITLTCNADSAVNFMLDIKGFVYQDGHMEGTMVATNAFDANYHHTYHWSVS
jgi:hypothetical protein